MGGLGISADSNLRQVAGEARKKTSMCTSTEMAMLRFHSEKRKRKVSDPRQSLRQTKHSLFTTRKCIQEQDTVTANTGSQHHTSACIR